MKANFILLFIIIAQLWALSLDAQLWAIVGRNEDGRDGYTIVCTKDVTTFDVVYITEDEYNNSTNKFSSGESLVAYTPPAGGHNAGEVISIQEMTSASSNIPEIVGCSSNTCGTLTYATGEPFSIGVTDELYAFSDTDGDPTNGVTEIYSVWFWNNSLSGNEDPTGDFPNAIKLEISGDFGNVDFKDILRDDFVSKSDFEDPINYTQNTINEVLSTAPFTANLVLPTELTRFYANEARKSGIRLNWETATETDNEKFEVERSTDGVTFSIIGEVQGTGSTVEHQTYSLVDNAPVFGTNYYRLKQLNFDGRFEYSEIINVLNTDSDQQRGHFYPNPSHSGNVSLDYYSATNSSLNVSVFDVSGALMFRQNNQAVEGANNLKLDLTTLGRGLYIIRLGDEADPVHRKVVVN
ncbi:MAG: hypothetical protein ACJAX1_001476 [Neolewinella sp.]|jgi:hypothetical protein